MIFDALTWAEEVKSVQKKKAYCTRWFPGTIAPARAGYYERYYVDGLYRHYFDGKNWRHDKNTEPHWRQVGDYPAWRGLTLMGYLRNKGSKQ